MQKSILRSCFSILLWMFCLPTHAQEATVDTLETRNKYLPTGLRIGTDVITIVKSNLSKQFTGWEVNADVDINRYYLAVDYGRWAISKPLSNGLYNNDGSYFRFGIDVNFLKRDPDRNMFFLGFRIGQASFNDNASYTYTLADPATNPVTSTVFNKSLVNTNLTGHWAELTTGLRIKIYKFFWMGYTARMKFAPSVSGEQELVSYDIPGFGLASRKLYWGFNYQLFFKIPFTSKAAPIPDAKK